MDLVQFLSMSSNNLKFEVSAKDLADFGKAIAQQVIDEFKEKLEQADIAARRQYEGAYLSSTQICEKLGISRSTLWQWRQRGVLTPIKVGGQNRYDPEAIKQMLGESKVPTYGGGNSSDTKE